MPRISYDELLAQALSAPDGMVVIPADRGEGYKISAVIIMLRHILTLIDRLMGNTHNVRPQHYGISLNVPPTTTIYRLLAYYQDIEKMLHTVQAKNDLYEWASEHHLRDVTIRRYGDAVMQWLNNVRKMRPETREAFARFYLLYQLELNTLNELIEKALSLANEIDPRYMEIIYLLYPNGGQSVIAWLYGLPIPDTLSAFMQRLKIVPHGERRIQKPASVARMIQFTTMTREKLKHQLHRAWAMLRKHYGQSRRPTAFVRFLASLVFQLYYDKDLPVTQETLRTLAAKNLAHKKQVYKAALQKQEESNVIQEETSENR